MPMVKVISVVLVGLLLSGCESKPNYEELKKNPQFVALLMEQQRNPEAFGMRIMRAQMAYANAKGDCESKLAEVKMLQAVVGVSTPD